MSYVAPEGVESALDMYRDGMSIPRVADALGWPRSRVRTALIRHGVQPRELGESIRMAAKQGLLGRRGPRGPFSDAAKANMSASAHRRWEGKSAGTCLANGYLVHTTGPNKGRHVHRTVMESVIGRRLLRWEHVHHKDHCRSNNDPDNLELMTASEHGRHHRLSEPQRDRDTLGRLTPKDKSC